jgi:hypothetical protein
VCAERYRFLGVNSDCLTTLARYVRVSDGRHNRRGQWPSLSNFSPNLTQAEKIRILRKPEFHARAWKAAKAKARELGWIV